MTRAAADRAAIFIDYENLYALLKDRLERRDHADACIVEILDALRHYLSEHQHTRTALVVAFADFGQIQRNGQDLQRTLYLQGAEPRFVPASLQPGAVQMQLCLEAMDVLHSRQDIQSFVLVTGDRPYLPLVQQLRRYGRTARVVALEHPPETDLFSPAEADLFLDALALLDDPPRPRPPAARGRAHNAPGSAPLRNGHPPHERITDAVGLHTLELIEEHFGQYDEVYLTPLLRKMSEVFDEAQHDPKMIISALEQAGAVWLEKRRGFPYDYTVLLLNLEHPDVQQVRQAFMDEPAAPHEGRSRRTHAQEDTFGPDELDDEAWSE